MCNKPLLEMHEMSSLKHQKTSTGSREQLIQVRPPPSKLRGDAAAICACFADFALQ